MRSGNLTEFLLSRWAKASKTDGSAGLRFGGWFLWLLRIVVNPLPALMITHAVQDFISEWRSPRPHDSDDTLRSHKFDVFNLYEKITQPVNPT